MPQNTANKKKSGTPPKPKVVTIIPGVPVPTDEVDESGHLKPGALERIATEHTKQEKKAAAATTQPAKPGNTAEASAEPAAPGEPAGDEPEGEGDKQ